MKNILIVGVGSIGERHLRCFQKTGRATVAVCEINSQLRERVVTEYDVKTQFASLGDALQQPFDAAVICTPANLHIPMAMQVAECDIGVLLEKPLSTTFDGIDELQALVNTRKLTAGVAYVMRHHPALAAMKNALDSGRFGRPVQVVYVGGQHFPFYRPAYRETYYTRHETGGGAIQDAATHQFNMVQYLAGDFDWVFCDSGHQALEGVEVEDTVHLTGRTGGGRTMVNASLNQFMAPNETVVRLNCRGGSVKLVFHEQNIGTLRHGDDDWTWNPPAKLERDDLFREQARRFLAAADGQEPVRCTLDEAEHTLKVNLAALKSAGRERVEIQ